MKSYGQKRLNKADVRKGTRNFIMSFIILCAVTFSTVFLFFKSADMQNKEIRNNLEANENLKIKSQQLNVKLKEIYNDLERVNNSNMKNVINLQQGISKDIRSTREILKEDSISDLKHIAKLLNQMDDINKYKSVFERKQIEEKGYKKQLEICREKNNKIASAVVQKKNKENKGKLFQRK